MTSDAMGLYSLTERNKVKLKGCEFSRVENLEQFKGVAFVFNDPYRKLNIDVVFTDYGETLISDYYGESMNRNDIFYVILRH
ncbi:MAG: hypothetical protein KBS60_00130 [Phascolarctobacterium sp.]|nr:hypothetical protein [Candidatus Phascolarctobacterium caballi]